MLSKKTIEILKDAGSNDTYVEDILIESARKFIEENSSIKEEDMEKAIDYYREGFLG